MTYEKGSYLQELDAAHRTGEHDEDKNSDCLACFPHGDLLGFGTSEEAERAIQEGSRAMEVATEAHARGEHKARPDRLCAHEECEERLDRM